MRAAASYLDSIRVAAPGTPGRESLLDDIVGEPQMGGRQRLHPGRVQTGDQIGQYEALGELGRGGMGKVYKVRHLISGRLEAMKVLLPELSTESEPFQRFLREIQVQAGLQHPNIAKLYTALCIEDQLLLFMELVEGTTLAQR